MFVYSRRWRSFYNYMYELILSGLFITADVVDETQEVLH